MDIDNIPLGVDFREHVKFELVKSGVMLAVVGPKWFGAAEASHSRIASEFDPVRVEIEIALQQGTPIIPLLVLGASIPTAADLPESIRNFAFKNAAYIDSGRDFHHHMDQVIRSVSIVLKAGRASPRRPWQKIDRTTLVGFVGFVLLAMAAWFHDSASFSRFHSPSTQIAAGPTAETRADTVMGSSLALSQQQDGTIEITNIVANDYIEGVFTGIANPENIVL